jgi:hypothetical protein
LAAAAAVELTVEMVAAEVSFDTALQLVRGCRRAEQNFRFKSARAELVVAGQRPPVALQELPRKCLGEVRHVLLQIPELVVEAGHLP